MSTANPRTLPSPPPPSAALPPLAVLPLAGMAAALVAVELGFGLFGRYGLFIDELYYLACAARLDWGYVDHPPLAPAILRLTGALVPDPAWALRLPAALAGAAVVMVTGLLARRFGAGVYGQCLAALGVLIAPIHLLVFGFFSMNPFEVLIWSLCALLLVLIEQRRDPRLWLAFGALAGVGLLNKHTMVLFAIGLGVGMIATSARRHFVERDLWLGLAIAAMIFLPNVLWQVAHDWLSLAFYRGATFKNVPTPPHEVLAMQVLTMSPVNLALWGTGLVALLASARLRPYRHLGVLAATLLVLAMAAQQSRPDRLAGIYPLLFAAGAAVLDRFTAERRRALRVAIPTVLLAGGAVLVPVCLPVLPPESMARYVAGIGFVPQVERGPGKTADLPQWYADRFGWPELARDVAEIALRLDADERRRTAVIAPSYGQAGALELFGTPDGMPVYSTHNNYFLWGPPPPERTTGIVIGDTAERLGELFEEVEPAGVHDCDWCMRWRDEMPIWIVRKPRRPIAEIWADRGRFG